MHGQHCGKRQQQWHMWPGPSQRPVLGTVTDSASGKCFSKAGRKVGVGDCALFQAGNAPPFIGIIRKLTAEKEGNHKLGVNWLYRPGDIKLGKGVSVEATPNEVFYSFHKDEISAASLLHPCKVAFLRKGVELPSGVSSFVCRRVYDVTNKCLYWLTDQDYTDECQQEVDQLLDRTKHEMQAAVQSGVSSQRAVSGPTSSPQSKTDATNAAFPCQGKGKKRERTDQSLDPCKRERSVKLEDCDLGPMKRDCSIELEEIRNITDKDGGLLNIPAVDQLVQVMHQERNDSAKKSGDVASRRTLLASIVAATERDDCLTRFVRLGGLPVLDDWLQEAHKGKFGDGASPKEGDKVMEELSLTLLRALDKLPIDLDALKTCPVGKSVNNLRGHRNFEIQKKSRKLVETWKKRVDAEMNSSAESKSGLNPATSWSCKQPSIDMHGVKVRCTTEGASAKSPLGMKPVVNGSCPGDTKCNVISGSGCKEPPGSPLVTVSKDNPIKFHASGTSEVILAAVKEEKSSSSSQSQNNSQSWCSGSVKGAGSWREEVKTSSAVSTGTKTTAMTPHSIIHSGKGHAAASLTGPPKESANVKHSVWNKTSGSEKVTSSALMEKGAAESARTEIANNQRLIVRLPNPGRSPACSANGSPFADGGASASRASPPSLQERHDLMDEKSKSLCAAPAVHSPVATGDTKSGNGSGSGGKPGADCTQEKERSCGATADDVDCKPLDAESVHKETEASLTHSNLSAGKGLADGVQFEFVRKCNAASGAAVGCSELIPEVQDEGGIDLLASVAACEGSEAEKIFSGAVGEGLNSPVNDGSKERAKQSLLPNESESKDKSEDLLVSNEDDDKWKKPSVKILLEPGCAAEIVDTGSVSVQEVKGPVDARKEPSVVLTSPQSPEDRAREGALESTLVSANNVIAARGSEALAGSQDGCGGVKVVRRENTKEEKVSTLKVSTDICTSSSFPGDDQTCTASGSNNVGLLEEGFEDAKKSSSSSPSSLVRMSSMGDVEKTVDSLSGYYEEDALEVARKVAKEVEQEVERYGKPEMRDIASFSVSKTESRLESPVCENANNQLIPSGAVEARVKCPDQDRCHTDTAVYSDDSQETVTEKREGMEVDRIPPAGNEGDEVDQASFSLRISENMRPALESELGSSDDMKEVRELAVLEGYCQSVPAAVNKELMDAAVCNIQAAEAPVLDQAVEFTTVSNDGKCGSSGTCGRPIFDLNEGFVADEVHDGAIPAMVSPLNPTVLVPNSPSGLPAVMSSSLAAPIAVMAASKGAFIPPSTLSRSKGEPGWKGSAATSAFRPAEPRRIAETFQLPSDTPCTGATADVSGQGGKRARVLDIDLNVADERVMEDVGMAMSLPSRNDTTSLGLGSQVPTGSANESSSAGVFANSSPVTSRPELDLNRVDESEESTGPLMSDSRDAEVLVKNDNKFPLASSRVLRDFDLNDGPGLEESMGEGPLSQQSNVRSLENSALPGLPGMRSNPEIVNVASWYPAANPLHNMVMPAFSAGRAESSYPVVAAPTAKSVITMGHSLSPFNGDIYRAGTVMPSSPAVSYSTVPPPFPYAGFPFGSAFPFTSASYNISSPPYGASSSSPPFPTAPSQLVSAGAVVSPYGRPYLMGITEVPGAETGASWTRPNLDLNAGPDAADTDGREEARQMPALGQISFQQGESSGTPLKRKEPESGFDPFRSGVKQMVWR